MIAAIAACAGIASAQHGMVTYLGQEFTGGGNNGGVFNMRVDSRTAAGEAAGLYSPGTVWRTFCVELTENMPGAGSSRNAQVNDRAIGGGTFDSDGIPGNGGDLLSVQTAYLFSQFHQGLSGDFADDFTTYDSQRAMQLAIWHFEEGIDVSTDQVASAGQRALAAIYIAAANLSGWTSIGNVRVLNYGPATAYGNQDVLIIIPLPQAGALAGLGLAGLAVRRRRAAL
jgi:hypothetical protein